MKKFFFENSVRPTMIAGEALTAGALCYADQTTGKLRLWGASAPSGAMIFCTLDDAANDTPVGVIAGGVTDASAIVTATAGAYAPGKPVYATTGGKVKATNAGSDRVAGICLDAPITTTAEGELHIALVYSV